MEIYDSGTVQTVAVSRYSGNTAAVSVTLLSALMVNRSPVAVMTALYGYGALHQETASRYYATIAPMSE